MNSTQISDYRDPHYHDYYKNVLEERSIPFEKLSLCLSMASNIERLKILYMLNHEGRISVNDMVDVLQMTFPAVSQHLRKLRDANLVEVIKHKQTHFYVIHSDYRKLLTPFFEMIDKKKLLKILS